MTGTTGRARRLRKRDVEALLARYDDDPVAALEGALQALTGRPDATFATLIELLVGTGAVPDARGRALLRHDLVALDALAAELNETRELPS